MSLLLLLPGAPAPLPSAPPVGLEDVCLKRVSPTIDAPALDARGRPDGWAETSTLVEDWGRFQVLFGTTDVTFLRDIPCEVLSYSTAEPFGDETAQIKFPQIGPFDALGAGDLAAFVDGCDVTIRRVYFDTTYNEERVDPDWSWNGFWVTDNVEHDEDSGGTTFDCLGVLYEADLRLAKPSLDPILLADVSRHIFVALSGVLSGDQFRFAPPVIPQDYPNPGDFGIGVEAPALGAYQPILTGLVQDYLAMAVDPATNVQWTVTNDEREADIVLKDVSTVHWTVTTGTKGLTLRLSKDLTMAPNALYGSGFSPYDGCEWRNAYYPGLLDGDLFGALIRPLDVEGNVEPDLYDSNGTVTGPNPFYDPAALRVERYENFGRVSRVEALASASFELLRESVPDYAGTLTLHIDPREGSRWTMRAGTNAQLLAFRGGNPILHISRVVASPPRGTVELTVDTKARDLPTLAAHLNRQRDNTDLVRRNRPTRNTSRLIIDRTVPWDCESGGGVIAATSVPALGWAVVRTPVGTRGRVVFLELTASSAVEMAVGIFDRPIYPSELAGKGAPADDDYWSWDNWSETSGLVQAVGAGDDLGGYWPLAASDDLATITGKIKSDQGFPYESQQPPWLWVAVWATGATTVSGMLTPGPQGDS